MGVSIRPSDFVNDEEDRVYSDYENTATGEVLRACVNCKHYSDSNMISVTRHYCWKKNKILDDPIVEVCWRYKQKKRVKPFHVYIANPTLEQRRELGLGHLIKGTR